MGDIGDILGDRPTPLKDSPEMDPEAPIPDLDEARAAMTTLAGNTVRTGKVGRPSKFTKERRDYILNALRAGNYVSTVIAAAGIGRHTYYDWIREGRVAAAKLDEGFELSEREQEFLDFAVGVVQAEAEAEVRLVTHWSAAAANDWRAAKDLLARRHAGKWKEVQGTEISGPDGIPLGEGGQVDERDIAALARQLAIRAGTDADIEDAEVIEDDAD